LESISSAAKTLPPQRGQPWPSGALIVLVSIALKAKFSIPFLYPRHEINKYKFQYGYSVLATIVNVRNRVSHQESATSAESVSFRPEFLGVAELTVDVTIGPVTGQHRVQYAFALFAVEASLVPNLKENPNNKNKQTKMIMSFSNFKF
jgi:hypothetical protein